MHSWGTFDMPPPSDDPFQDYLDYQRRVQNGTIGLPGASGGSSNRPIPPEIAQSPADSPQTPIVTTPFDDYLAWQRRLESSVPPPRSSLASRVTRIFTRDTVLHFNITVRNTRVIVYCAGAGAGGRIASGVFASGGGGGAISITSGILDVGSYRVDVGVGGEPDQNGEDTVLTYETDIPIVICRAAGGLGRFGGVRQSCRGQVIVEGGNGNVGSAGSAATSTHVTGGSEGETHVYNDGPCGGGGGGGANGYNRTVGYSGGLFDSHWIGGGRLYKPTGLMFTASESPGLSPGGNGIGYTDFPGVSRASGPTNGRNAFFTRRVAGNNVSPFVSAGAGGGGGLAAINETPGFGGNGIMAITFSEINPAVPNRGIGGN